jgi:AhpD family alkylhydroperoxidase
MEEIASHDGHTDPTAVRLDFDALAPRFAAAMSRLDAVAGVGLDPHLRELVRLHASTINGCAYCVDMHSKDARAIGETEQRLYSLGAWRETAWFTPAERAALALTEAVTVLHRDHVPHDVVDEAARHFEPEALAQLIALLVTINAWNRIGVTTRCWEPGSYQVEG